MFVEGEEIRLEGECRVDHDSLLFFNGRLGMPISDKWSGFSLGHCRDFKVLRSKGSMCAFLMFLKECLGSGREWGWRGAWGEKDQWGEGGLHQSKC